MRLYTASKGLKGFTRFSKALTKLYKAIEFIRPGWHTQRFGLIGPHTAAKGLTKPYKVLQGLRRRYYKTECESRKAPQGFVRP